MLCSGMEKYILQGLLCDILFAILSKDYLKMIFKRKTMQK